MVNIVFTRLIVQVPLVVEKTGVLLIRISYAKFTPIYSGKQINHFLEAFESYRGCWDLCWCDDGRTHGECPGKVSVYDE